MAFPTLPAHETRGAELVALYRKPAGSGTFTLLGQGSSFGVTSEAEERESRRIGAADATINYGAASHRVNAAIYTEGNMEELAAVLGVVRPGGGWLGSEIIKLDPSLKSDFMAVRYDANNATGIPKSVQYVNAFIPGSLEITVEAGTNDEIATINGSCASHYIMPIATS